MRHSDIAEALSLQDEQYQITTTELTRASGLSAEEVQELVEFGVFEPQGQGPSTWVFSAQCITWARTASRLRRDLEINGPAWRWR